MANTTKVKNSNKSKENEIKKIKNENLDIVMNRCANLKGTDKADKWMQYIQKSLNLDANDVYLLALNNDDITVVLNKDLNMRKQLKEIEDQIVASSSVIDKKRLLAQHQLVLEQYEEYRNDISVDVKDIIERRKSEKSDEEKLDTIILETYPNLKANWNELDEGIKNSYRDHFKKFIKMVPDKDGIEKMEIKSAKEIDTFDAKLHNDYIKFCKAFENVQTQFKLNKEEEKQMREQRIKDFNDDAENRIKTDLDEKGKPRLKSLDKYISVDVKKMKEIDKDLEAAILIKEKFPNEDEFNNFIMKQKNAREFLKEKIAFKTQAYYSYMTEVGRLSKENEKSDLIDKFEKLIEDVNSMDIDRFNKEVTGVDVEKEVTGVDVEKEKETDARLKPENIVRNLIEKTGLLNGIDDKEKYIGNLMKVIFMEEHTEENKDTCKALSSLPFINSSSEVEEKSISKILREKLEASKIASQFNTYTSPKDPYKLKMDEMKAYDEKKGLGKLWYRIFHSDSYNKRLYVLEKLGKDKNASLEESLKDVEDSKEQTDALIVLNYFVNNGFADLNNEEEQKKCTDYYINGKYEPRFEFSDSIANEKSLKLHKLNYLEGRLKETYEVYPNIIEEPSATSLDDFDSPSIEESAEITEEKTIENDTHIDKTITNIEDIHDEEQLKAIIKMLLQEKQYEIDDED